MKKRLFFSVYFTVTYLLLISMSGCGSKSSRPTDLPPLEPCKITVFQEGKPLEGAIVTLISKDTSAKYARSSGATNTSGIAELKTYGYSGVPKGSYKITVTKSAMEGGKEITDASGVTSTRGGKDYSYVEKKYTDVLSTPLEIEIGNKENLQTVEIGKSVHDFIGVSP
ncbi:MAG: carboxypeptidase-like regulatory domain-containing protein [Planctomycetaceae bacterium]|nr:carboxypeptidase-like regulatory domain-containing protein [Planctomycetaceae bacterium]